MRIILATALLAVAASSPALAQDRAPFTGPRVEGIVGWDRNQTDAGHKDGVVYGGAIGYDFQLGGAVAGIEAEATDSSADACAHDVTVTGDRLCVGAKRDLYVGGRIGAVVGGSNLIYAKAGYTNARFGYDYDDGGTGANDYGDGRNLDGVRVGAGIEHQFGRNTYIKAEYRYSNYEQGVEKHQAVAGFGFRF